MTPDWEKVLDVLEERVEAHRAVLHGAQAAPPYELPSEIGPLPLELAARACSILARQRELEDDLIAHMAELRNLFGRSQVSRPVPIYLDRPA